MTSETGTDGDVVACVLPHGIPQPAYIGWLCRRHYHHVDEVLTELAARYAELELVLVPGPAGGSGGRGSAAVYPAAPGRLEVMAVTDPRGGLNLDGDGADGPDIPDVAGAVLGWAAFFYDSRGRRRTPRRPSFAGAVWWLRDERHWIAQQPEVGDYATDLDVQHRALAHATGNRMTHPVLPIACPNCGRHRLVDTIGLDEVACGRCHTVFAGTALVRLRLIEEQQESRPRR